MPPVNRPWSRAAGTALLFAVGGTAWLAWALNHGYNYFTEEKKKPGASKALKAPTGSNGSLADPARSGTTTPAHPARSGSSTPARRSKESSPALSDKVGLLADKAAGYRPGKCDFLPENLFYPKDEKRPSLIIENKSATQSLNSISSAKDDRYPVYEKLRPEQPAEQPSTVPADNRHDSNSPFQSPEADISPTTLSLVQNAPKFDSLYNQSFTKTSVSDDVMTPDPDDFPALRQNDPSKGLLESRLSQVDTKINTFEEKEPASHEMLTTDEVFPDMTTSVSTKSLQSAALRYPPARSKPGESLGNVLTSDVQR